jgi:hypothetical protein
MLSILTSRLKIENKGKSNEAGDSMKEFSASVEKIMMPFLSLIMFMYYIIFIYLNM